MRKVDISIELVEPVRKIVVQSLLPELGKTVPRTQVNISENNVGITVSFKAETTSALRAALNSYLRWLNCIISIASTFNQENQKV